MIAIYNIVGRYWENYVKSCNSIFQEIFDEEADKPILGQWHICVFFMRFILILCSYFAFPLLFGWMDGCRLRSVGVICHLETPLGRVSQARVIARVAATQLE